MILAVGTDGDFARRTDGEMIFIGDANLFTKLDGDSDRRNLVALDILGISLPLLLIGGGDDFFFFCADLVCGERERTETGGDLIFTANFDANVDGDLITNL